MSENAEAVDFTPPFGMTARQTASYVAGFIEDSSARMLRLATDKGGYQEFEGNSLEEALTLISEDLQDLAAHAALLHIQVRRAMKVLAGEREVVVHE